MERPDKQAKQRREIVFSGFTNILSIFAIFILSACKIRSRNQRNEHQLTVSGPNEALPEQNVPVLDNPLENSNPLETEEKCETQTNYVDWQQLKDAGENLEPMYKFYGDSTSSMMVLALPKYEHGSLLEIYLVRSSGQLIAQKGISDSADINPYTNLIPVVFENIQLKNDNKLIIIFKSSCRNCVGGFSYTKHEMPYRITFVDFLFGKKVYSISPNQISEIYPQYQAFANIGPKADSPEGYHDQGTYTTASSLAEFSGTESLKNCVITDMIGNLLADKGEMFHDIMNYPEFICYRLVDDKFYIRTFIRMF